MLIKFSINCSLKRKVNLFRTLCHHAHRICSLELLSNEMKEIILLLNKNSYPQELVNKTIKLHLKNLDRIKATGPEKCIITLKVPFINKS